MLTIYVGDKEFFDEESGKFTTQSGKKLDLEHSLVSLSKWESIHEKPFLGKDEKSVDEILSYIRCMILAPEVDPEILNELTDENFREIHTYIESKQSATTFADRRSAPNRETITAELIYYWMVAYNIPFECQFWHLNRLLTLIRVCNIKNQNQNSKKMNRSEMLRQRRDLNAQRKAQYGTSG